MHIHRNTLVYKLFIKKFIIFIILKKKIDKSIYKIYVKKFVISYLKIKMLEQSFPLLFFLSQGI